MSISRRQILRHGIVGMAAVGYGGMAAPALSGAALPKSKRLSSSPFDELERASADGMFGEIAAEFFQSRRAGNARGEHRQVVQKNSAGMLELENDG